MIAHKKWALHARALVGSLLASLALIGMNATAYAAPTTGLVPFRMDGSNQAGWWKPLEEFNGSIYMAYNAWGGPGATNGGSTDTHTIYVAKRAPDGTWTRGCLKDGNGICAVYPDDVGHRQPTIAIDGDGFIHVFASMHDNDWRYWRSGSAEDVTSMNWKGNTMPDQNGDYTYPSATRSANGDVYMIIRAYPDGRLYRWNNAANTWSRVATFASTASYTVYPDDISSDDAGNLHIGWEWAYNGHHGIRHLGSYLRYSPTSAQFYNAAGTQMTLPVSILSPVVYQPLEGTESSQGNNDAVDPGVQSAKVTINPTTGRPMIGYRYRSVASGPFRVRMAEWDGSAWQRQVVYAGTYNTYPAVDISTNGATGVRVYYAKTQTFTGSQAFAATRQANGTWLETELLPTAPIERLSVIKRGTTDHLYLASPTTQDLYYGTFPW